MAVALISDFQRFEQPAGQVASTVHHALDAQRLAADAIKNKVTPNPPANWKRPDARQFPCAKFSRLPQSRLPG
jgi:hypothetical protein